MLASTLIREARRTGLASELIPVGSLRRFSPDVGDVSLVGLAAPGRQPQLVDAFSRLPAVTGVLERHSTAVSVATARGTAMLHVTTPDHLGAALAWHTASKRHTGQLQLRAKRRGLTFHAGIVTRAGGEMVPTPTEDEFYRLLDLPFIPPELREGADEIEAADRGALPNLVSDLHIRGDLHMHSTWSDGRDSIEEMVLAARQIGYEYVAITDHSERAMSSRSLSSEDVPRQRRELDELRARTSGLIDVLWGVEVDIMQDGSLDFDDATLSRFDIVLASLHDHGGQDPATLLDRYARAMANPFVNIITHPANRSPAYSTGYELDFDRLFSVAVETGTALEIDGAPGHLDMDGLVARRAIAAGVTVVVDSDCHRKDALARQMRFGLGTARRGWVEPQHVLNTRDAADVRAFVAQKRAGR
jgi:DNA polymerase (family 10)